MGKMNFLISLIVCFYSLHIYSQQYEAVYEIVYKPRLNDSLKLKDNYVLRFDTQKKSSFFTSLNEENSLNFSIYKNFEKESFIKYESIVDDLYSINYIFDNSKWQLLEDNKRIEDFNCKKAKIIFGNRIWEAWYTIDIPFQDGPYKFSGLPGLIIEIYSIDEDYRFLMKGITKKDQLVITKLPATNLSTSKQERDVKSRIILDPAISYRNKRLKLENRNIGVKVSYNGKEIPQKETEKRIVKNFEKWREEHDNPIEKGDLWIK
ncbi:GLPGLI family protein [Chryseobacterium taklimakanense]|uniref:GLPGLI family protein n=1 Tax=Chryseobacterium taklimakanense TaxID=536441 RepID=A0A239XNK3_9FLAO|nr:GLPGLI family protein [Chryseobacterium taklimakanense]SNV48365.1 GLPGLI family protein [Chryseobacterium taklimakanense]